MASVTGVGTHTEGTFTARDGVELFEQSWAIESPKATVVIVHGWGEHSARYDHVAYRLNDAGYSVYTYDQRGHGNSPGKSGYVTAFKPLPEDLDVFLDGVRARAGSAPLFLMGHSMGSLVLASYVLDYKPQVTGLVFSGTAVKIGDEVKPMLQKVSGLLSALAPWLPVHAIPPEDISRIPEEVKKYEEDPLNHHGKMLARTAGELLAATRDVQGRLGEIRSPFITMHGTADRLVNFAASQLLFENGGAEDKTIKLYEGAYHEVFNDHERDEFISDLIAWLDARC